MNGRLFATILLAVVLGDVLTGALIFAAHKERRG